MGMIDDLGRDAEAPASGLARTQTLSLESARSKTTLALPNWITRVTNVMSVVHPSLLPLALAPALCTLALLFAGERPLDDVAASAALGAALFAMMSVGALTRWRAAAQMSASERAWSPLRPDANGSLDDIAAWVGPARRWGLWVGYGALALAAGCVAGLALMAGVMSGDINGVAVASVGGGCLLIAALSCVVRVRRLIAPADMALAAAALGPGVVVVVTMGQRHAMSPQTWLLASAFGLFALSVLVARDVVTAEEARRTRSVAALFGERASGVIGAIATLLALAYASTVALTIMDGRLPGTLLALASLPAAVIGVTGLSHSAYQPAREQAAERIAEGYLWFGVGGLIGLVLIPTLTMVVAVAQFLIGG